MTDTITIALKTDANNEYNAIKGFAKIVRRFISYSLTKALFFRGAFSILARVYVTTNVPASAAKPATHT